VREKFVGSEIELCSVVNAKSGRCSEDCKFCAQSIHYHTDVETYSLLPLEKLLKAAKEAKVRGADRFGIVTSGKRVGSDLKNYIKAIKKIREETGLKICASFGILNLEEAWLLKKAGVDRYLHNLETSQSYFNQVCTTHAYVKRIETVKLIREAGMEVGSGGIFGLGEAPEQRIELAFALKELNVDDIHINILHPIKGTPLENAQPISPLEILKTIAIYRFILPDKIIRVCGGRERNLRDLQSLSLLAGANGVLIGNYLTTLGRPPEKDVQMIRDLELIPSYKES